MLPDPEPIPVPVVNDQTNQISAFKTGTPLIDVPRSVSVVSEERIEQQGFTSIGEIVDYTPGLTNSQGEGHRDSVVFRGVRSTADFFVDGVRDDVQYYRSLYNVDRVEIIRGPGALYFGRGGTGGLINRVTKKPVFGDTFGSLETSVDSFGGNLTQFDYNLPFGAGGADYSGKQVITQEPFAALRLNAFYEYLNNHRDHYDGNRFGVNPTLALQLGPDTRLDLSYEYNNHERFIDRGIPSGPNGRPAAELKGTTFGDSRLNTTWLESHAAKVTLSHEFSSAWKGTASAFYGTYDKSYRNFLPSSYDSNSGIVGIDGYVDNVKRSTWSFSGDLVGEFATGSIEHKAVLGAQAVFTSSDQNRYNALWNTTQDDVDFFRASNFRLHNGRGVNAAGRTAIASLDEDLNDDTRVSIDSYSAFFSDEIALGDHLDLILGGRYDVFDIGVRNAVNGEFRTRRDQRFSPRAGLVLKPTESLSLYGSYSESFLPRSGEQFANINGDNNQLDPNEYTNMEAGIKYNITPDLALTAAVFQIEESSPQVSDSDPGTLDVIDTETLGAELTLEGAITDRWSIAAGYSYLDGEQVDASGAGTGLRPRELPRHTFSLWNNYQFTERFGAGLGVVYQDSSFSDNGNTVTLPSYTRVDAALYYQLSDRAKLQLNVENLLDTEYFPNSHTADNISVGRPINAALSLKINF